MIIRPQRDSYLFITQPDHAALAAQAIAHWQAEGFPNHPRRDVVLLAAREHDNGWIEEDTTTYVDQTGAPLDFVSVPADVRQRIWPRAAERMAARSPYAAALIAQHALTVYGSMRSDPAWNGFFTTMVERRDTLRECAGIDAGTLERDYLFVNAADRISLAFCTEWKDALESHGRRIILTDRNAVTVAPDPFAGAAIPLRVRARRLPRQAFGSSAALRHALYGAALEFLEGTALGSA